MWGSSRGAKQASVERIYAVDVRMDEESHKVVAPATSIQREVNGIFNFSPSSCVLDDMADNIDVENFHFCDVNSNSEYLNNAIDIDSFLSSNNSDLENSWCYGSDEDALKNIHWPCSESESG